MNALDPTQSNAKFASAPTYLEEKASHPNARVDLRSIVEDGPKNVTWRREYGHGQSIDRGDFPAARFDFVTGHHHCGKSAGISIVRVGSNT